MHRGVAISILVALVLIGGAFWYRMKGSTQTQGLTLTDSSGSDSFSDEDSALISIASNESVNKTSNLGQQLLSDLITLNSTGQATEANIQALTDHYVENLPELVNVKTVSKADVNIVGTSKSEFSAYSQAIGKILTEYNAAIKSVAPKTSSLDAEFYTATGKMAAQYTATANALKSVSVPSSVAELHVTLINIYLSNSAASFALSQTATDPAKSFSGLVMLEENTTKEKETLGAIDMLLRKNGV